MLSTLHSSSGFGTKSELELFDLPFTQFSHENSEYVEFHPISSKADEADTIEFYIPNAGQYYVDPTAIFLYTKAKVTKANGQDLDAFIPPRAAVGAEPAVAEGGDKVAPVDNFANSLFQHVDIFLNQKLITRHEYYTYRSYIDILTNANIAQHVCSLHSVLFHRDKPGQALLDQAQKDNGSTARYERIAESKTFDMMTPLFTDLAQQPKLLINGVDIRIVLRQNNDDFRFITGNENRHYKLKIEKLLLYVRRVTISPSVLMALEKRLQTNPAVYAIRGCDTRIRSIPTGSKDVILENLTQERLPSRMTVVFVRTDSFYGKSNTDPLHFENLNMQKSTLSVGNKEITEMYDFNDGLLAKSYLNLIRAIGNPLINLSYDEYKNSSFILHYVLTPDGSTEHFSPPMVENLRLHIELAAPLATPYTAIILMETPRIIEIDANRSVEVR